MAMCSKSPAGFSGWHSIFKLESLIKATNEMKAVNRPQAGMWVRLIERIASLVKSASSKIIGNDDIGDRIKYELYVAGVCGARQMAVNFFHRAAILGLELRLDVSTSILVRSRTCSLSTINNDFTKANCTMGNTLKHSHRISSSPYYS